MTRSLFSMSPFRAGYDLQPARLGLGSLLDDITDLVGDVGPLLKDFDAALAKLPVGVAGPFAARRDECLKKSTVEKYKCLYDLFQDVKKALKDEEDKVSPAPAPVQPQPSGSGFPVVPVVIGGIAAAAILYAVFKG